MLEESRDGQDAMAVTRAALAAAERAIDAGHASEDYAALTGYVAGLDVRERASGRSGM